MTSHRTFGARMDLEISNLTLPEGTPGIQPRVSRNRRAPDAQGAIGRHHARAMNEWFGAGDARIVHVLFVAFLALVTTFHMPLDTPSIDPFHEGEYLIYGTLTGDSLLDAPPVFIHGGINHIPPRIAAAACPKGHQIVCVRAINSVFIALTAAAYLGVLLLVTGVGTWRAFITGLPAMVTLIVYNGGAENIVRLQQGAPSIRELFIVMMLICIALLSRHAGHFTRWGRLSIVALLGAFAGLGLFWAYNRGLAAVILAAGGAGAFAVAWRDWRPLFWVVAGGVLGLAVASAMNLYGAFGGNVSNVLYWMKNDRIFWLPRDINMLLNVVPGAIVVTGLLVAGGLVAWRQAGRGQLVEAILPAALIGLIALYAVQIYARPDDVHISWVLWPAALLASDAIRELAEHPARPARPVSILIAAMVMSSALALYNIGAVASIPKRWVNGTLANFVALGAPLPADHDLVSSGLREATDLLRARAPSCTYSFSNDGLFYAVSGVPPCSRFAYPVYVSPGYQTAIIAELDRNHPPIVLRQSEGWWNSIDGLGLEQRTQALAQWITTHYPYRMTLDGGYELRSIEPFPKNGD
jgi:hypothetical protein